MDMMDFPTTILSYQILYEKNTFSCQVATSLA